MAIKLYGHKTISRRHALGTLGALTLVGCGGGSDNNSSNTVTSSGDSNSNASGSGNCLMSAPSCVVAPTETIGPYPAFTNGIVTLSSLWRKDITTDPAGTYSTRTGVPLEMIMKIVNVNNNCAPLVGYDVYVWHCDADGYYSYYSNQPGYLGNRSYANGYFLRGVQATDACGEVTFSTIFPGWYTGRYTHVHIAIALGATSEAVTQMTWPADIISDVYANASGYTAHGANTTSLANDNVFGGNTGQIATTTGSISAGYQSQWVLGIAI